MDSRKVDLVFYTAHLESIDMDYEEMYSIAKKNTARSLWKSYSRSSRIKNRKTK